MMKRNMPKVLNNTQTEAEFMPEAHLPDMPRIVDEQEYSAKKMRLDKSDLELLEMKSGTQDSQVARGDLVEKELFIELKKFSYDDVVAFYAKCRYYLNKLYL